MDMTPVPLAGRMGKLRSNAIRELLAITQRPDVISMAGGLPASDAFPVDEIRTVTARLLRDDPTSLLQYSTTEGFPELRAWIAEQAAASRGREVDPDQVLITHGSQQALDLVSKVFVDPGVEVAIDEPGYIGAIQALQVFEPALLPVPVDEHGIDSAALESLLVAGHRPRVLYTVVNFQNPTGATLVARTADAPRRARREVRVRHHRRRSVLGASLRWRAAAVDRVVVRQRDLARHVLQARRARAAGRVRRRADVGA